MEYENNTIKYDENDRILDKNTSKIQKINIIDKNASTKPTAKKAVPRQSSWGTATKGIVGFRNSGNTCFFNSIMQCLTQTTPLVKYVLGNSFQNDLKGKPEECNAAIAFRDTISAIWEGKQKIMDLGGLLRKFPLQGGMNSYYSFLQQEDSHELLQAILEKLMDAVNTGTKKIITKSKDSTGTNDEEVLEEFIKDFREANRSPIADMMYQFTRSRHVCSKCKKENTFFECASTLMVPIAKPKSKRTVLYMSYGSTKPKQLEVILPNDGEIQEITEIIKKAACTESKLAFVSEKKFVVPSVSSLFTVYEVPSEGKYALVQVYYNENDALCTPIIVRVDGEKKPEEEATEVLEKMWNSSGSASSPPKLAPTNDFNAGEKFKFNVPSTFTNEEDYDYLVKEQIIVHTNSAELEASKGFNWEPIPVPSMSQSLTKATLYDCLDKNFEMEQIPDWKCPYCNSIVTCESHPSLWYSPEVLIIVLKRFEVSSTGKATKINDQIDIPMELAIDNQKWARGKSKGKYHLYAASEHIGSMIGFLSMGHYITIAYNKETEQWYQASDESIELIPNIDQDRFRNAYVLFYLKDHE